MNNILQDPFANMPLGALAARAYLPSTLNLNSVVNVVISNIDTTASETRVFIQQLDNIYSYDSLMKHINLSSLKPIQSVNNLSPGYPCLVRNPEDFHLYRAVVISIMAKKVLVFTVDNGKIISVELNEIGLIDENSKKEHSMAISCQLVNINPMFKEYAIDIFSRYKNLVPLTAKVISYFNFCYSVELIDTTLDVNISLKEIINNGPSFIPSVPVQSQLNFPSPLNIVFAQSNPVSSSFFAHIKLPNYEEKNQIFNKRLIKTYQQVPIGFLSSPKIGDFCCVEIDGNPCTYQRAKICSFSNGIPFVEFIDTGHTKLIPFNKIKILIPELSFTHQHGFVCKFVDAQLQNIWSASEKSSAIIGSELTVSIVKSMPDLGGRCTFFIELVDSLETKAFLNLTKSISTGSLNVSATNKLHISPPGFQSTNVPLDPILSWPASGNLPADRWMECTVSHVESPSNFYVQLCKEEAIMQTLITRINEEAERMPHVDKMQMQMPLIVKYKEDGLWYRASVVEMNKSQIKVQFIDYGNTEMYDMDLSLFKGVKNADSWLPPLAYLCCLDGIKKNVDESVWTKENMQTFYSMIAGHQFSVHWQDERRSVTRRLPLVHMLQRKESLNIQFLQPLGYLDATYQIPIESIIGMASIIRSPVVPATFPITETAKLPKPLMQSSKQTSFEEIKLSVNVSRIAFISHIISPANFWCHLSIESEALEDQMDKLRLFYTDLQGQQLIFVDAPKPGQPCVARFTEDKLWYRAEVIKFEPNNRIRVFFVDYGNEDTVKFDENNIRIILPEFIHMKRQAIHCCLTSALNQKVFKEDEILYFHSKVEEKDLNILIKDVNIDLNGNCTYVVLLTVDGEEVNYSKSMAIKNSKVSNERTSKGLDNQKNYLESNINSNNQNVKNTGQYEGRTRNASDISNGKNNHNNYDDEIGKSRERNLSKNDYPQMTRYNNEKVVNRRDGHQADAGFRNSNLNEHEEQSGRSFHTDRNRDNQTGHYENRKSFGRNENLNTVKHDNKEKGFNLERTTNQNENKSSRSFNVNGSPRENEMQNGADFKVRNSNQLEDKRYPNNKDNHSSQKNYNFDNKKETYESNDNVSNKNSRSFQDKNTDLSKDAHTQQYNKSFNSRQEERTFGKVKQSNNMTNNTSISENFVFKRFEGTFTEKEYVLGSELQVVASCANSPSDFYLQELNKDAFISLAKDLNQSCSKFKNNKEAVIINPSIGLSCAAIFNQDGSWYRAQILNLNGEKLKIRFIDYGNIELTTCHKILALEACMGEIPMKSFKCCLFGVQSDQSWTKDQKKLFGDKITGTLKCKLIGKQDDRYVVEIVNDKNEIVNISTDATNENKVNFVDTMKIANNLVKLTNSDDSNKEKHAKGLYIGAPVPQIGIRLKSFISFFDINGDIFVQDATMNEALERMMEELDAFYNQDHVKHYSLEELSVNMPCSAKFLEDDKWYRAEIVSFTNECVRISFVDYGNQENYAIEHIFPLDQQFIMKPKFCFKCNLNCSNNQVEEVYSNLLDVILNEELSVEIINNDSSKITVNIFDAENINILNKLNKSDILNENDRLTSESVNSFNDVDVLITEIESAYKSGTLLHTNSDYIADVVYVDADGIIYLQLVDNVNQFETMMNELDTFYKDKISELNIATKLKVSMPCVAKFELDNIWYRSKVIEVLEDKANVEFVDFGNADFCNLSDVHTIDPMFLTNPIFVSKCKLASVELNMEGSADTILDEILGCKINFKVIDIENELYLIEIIKTIIEEIPKTKFSLEIVSPTIVSDKYQVMITHLDRSSLQAHVQLVRDAVQMESLLDRLSELCSAPPAQPDERENMLACVKYEATWHRCNIVGCLQEGVLVVKLVDVGKEVEVREEDVVWIDDEEISKMPAFAIQCMINLKDSNEDISSRLLSSLACNSIMTVNITNNNNSYIIDLEPNIKIQNFEMVDNNELDSDNLVKANMQPDVAANVEPQEIETLDNDDCSINEFVVKDLQQENKSTIQINDFNSQQLSDSEQQIVELSSHNDDLVNELVSKDIPEKVEAIIEKASLNELVLENEQQNIETSDHNNLLVNEIISKDILQNVETIIDEKDCLINELLIENEQQNIKISNHNDILVNENVSKDMTQNNETIIKEDSLVNELLLENEKQNIEITNDDILVNEIISKDISQNIETIIEKDCLLNELEKQNIEMPIQNDLVDEIVSKNIPQNLEYITEEYCLTEYTQQDLIIINQKCGSISQPELDIIQQNIGVTNVTSNSFNNTHEENNIEKNVLIGSDCTELLEEKVCEKQNIDAFLENLSPSEINRKFLEEKNLLDVSPNH